MNWQYTIDRYLEMEQILNVLFDELGYCMNQCILKPDPYGHMIHSACCRGRYYKRYDLDHPAYELFKVRRDKLYPAPATLQNIKRISPCEYLTLNGCLLKTHKSPVCLSFLCRDGIEFLRNEFGVFEYDYLGINYALEWILTGDLTGKAYDDFRLTCIEMVKKVTRSKKRLS